jgi:hypothetical protein
LRLNNFLTNAEGRWQNPLRGEAAQGIGGAPQGVPRAKRGEWSVSGTPDSPVRPQACGRMRPYNFLKITFETKVIFNIYSKNTPFCEYILQKPAGIGDLFDKYSTL